MWDPNDPGYLLDRESLRRMIQGIVRTEMDPRNSEAEEVYTTRRHNDKFRLVRGQSTANQSGPVIRLDNIVELAGGLDPSAGDATYQLRVANIYFPRSFSPGQYVDAIYSPDVIPSDNVLADGVTVDWETLESGTSSGTGIGFRRFALYENKLTTNDSAEVYWLDNDGNRLNSEIIFDPERLFGGRTDNYLTSGTGTGISTFGTAFQGIAQLRINIGTGTLGTAAPQQWEMVAMEGFAETITATYNLAEDDWLLGAYFGGQWERKQPQVVFYPIDLIDPVGIAPSPADGDTVVATLHNPNTSPPTYLVVGKAAKDRFVASGPLDSVPSTLIEKLHNTGVYDSETQELVIFEEFDDGGIRKVRAFYYPGSSGTGGSGTYGTGCGILLDTLTRKFSFDYDTVAGVGLEKYQPTDIFLEPVGCPNLRVTALQPGVLTSSVPIAVDGFGLDAGLIDPGNGTADLYRETVDTSKFGNLDGSASVENWSKTKSYSAGEQVLVGKTNEGHRFIIPLDGSGTGADIQIILIDEDIIPIEENGPYEFPSGTGTHFETTSGTAVDTLLAWVYTRTLYYFPFYRPTVVGDPGHTAGRSILSTVTSGTGTGGDVVVRYDTIPVYYDDGVPFEVGNYKKSDWEDFPENKNMSDLEAEFPDFSIKRRWRGIVIGNVLITSLCQVLPPPGLPEGFTNESEP